MPSFSRPVYRKRLSRRVGCKDPRLRTLTKTHGVVFWAEERPKTNEEQQEGDAPFHPEDSDSPGRPSKANRLSTKMKAPRFSGDLDLWPGAGDARCVSKYNAKGPEPGEKHEQREENTAS